MSPHCNPWVPSQTALPCKVQRSPKLRALGEKSFVIKTTNISTEYLLHILFLLHQEHVLFVDIHNTRKIHNVLHSPRQLRIEHQRYTIPQLLL